MNSIITFYQGKAIFLFCSFIFFLIISLIIGFLFKTEQGSIISGEIISEIKDTIQSPCSGIIQEVYFKNGDEIKTGDKILEFTKDSIGINIQSIDNTISQVQQKRKTFLEVMNFIDYEYNYLIKQTRNEIEILEKEIAQHSLIISFYEEPYTRFDMSEIEVEKMRIELHKLESQKIKLLGYINEIQNDYDLQIMISKGYSSKNIDTAEFENILNQFDDDLLLLQEKKQELQGLQKNPYIIAESSGIINFYESYYYNETYKNVINENEIICTIHENEKFIVKGLVSDDDLPHIMIGDEVYIEIMAYNYREYGVVHGIIDKIYPIPITDIEMGTLYYVDISLPPISVPIFNGMQVSVRINLHEEQSFLKFLVQQSFDLNTETSLDSLNSFYFVERKELD